MPKRVGSDRISAPCLGGGRSDRAFLAPAGRDGLDQTTMDDAVRRLRLLKLVLAMLLAFAMTLAPLATIPSAAAEAAQAAVGTLADSDGGKSVEAVALHHHHSSKRGSPHKRLTAACCGSTCHGYGTSSVAAVVSRPSRVARVVYQLDNEPIRPGTTLRLERPPKVG